MIEIQEIEYYSLLGLHSEQSHSGDVLGLLLAQQRSSSSPSRTGGDHCAHHDHPHQLRQRRPAQDILHEVHRHLSVCLFLHGVWSHGGIRLCGLHRQKNTTEEEQVRSHEEDHGGEATGGGEADGDAGSELARRSLLLRQTWGDHGGSENPSVPAIQAGGDWGD